jgi:hypothetical protein
MDIPINVKVNCSDGPCGETTRVILKPTTGEVTHVVITNNGAIQETEYLVEVNRILESSPEKVKLTLSRKELEAQPVFSAIHFVPSDLGGYIGLPYMMWPFYPAAVGSMQTEEKNIPVGELVIRRGARVEAVDGTVGKVDEFLIDPANDRITHLILREGHLWDKREVTIPVSQINTFENNTVYLRIKKEEVEKLPSVPVRRNADR